MKPVANKSGAAIATAVAALIFTAGVPMGAAHADAKGKCTGANACTLHYIDNTARLADGDLLLVDAGCEYDYYASDVTRTFPVNGKFTPEQRAIYEIVLEAQLAAIEKTRINWIIRIQAIFSRLILLP